MKELQKLAKILINLKTDKEAVKFFEEIFTPDEISVLEKRWCILEMLTEGNTQRDIAEKLKVSLCKITRGSKILKDKNTITYRYLNKEKKNERSNKK